MSSPISNNIGVGAAIAQTQPATAHRESSQVPTSAEIVQSSQEAAQRDAGKVRRDKERSPQIPKRVEDTYNASETEQDKSRKLEEEEDTQDNRKRLNMVA